jgi:hypothetical protein
LTLAIGIQTKHRFGILKTSQFSMKRLLLREGLSCQTKTFNPQTIELLTTNLQPSTTNHHHHHRHHHHYHHHATTTTIATTTTTIATTTAITATTTTILD